MRTTVDLPDELLRALKIRAAERGETIKDVLTRAVAHEVATGLRPEHRSRVALPLVADGAEPAIDVTADDIAAVLDSADERYAG